MTGNSRNSYILTLFWKKWKRTYVDIIIRGRSKADEGLRLSMYMDSMPTDDIPCLPSERLSRILGLTLNSKKLRDRYVGSFLVFLFNFLIFYFISF